MKIRIVALFIIALGLIQNISAHHCHVWAAPAGTSADALGSNLTSEGTYYVPVIGWHCTCNDPEAQNIANQAGLVCVDSCSIDNPFCPNRVGLAEELGSSLLSAASFL